MTEPWQTPEAVAAAEEKRRRRDAWAEQVDRERKEQERAEAAVQIQKLHVHDSETSTSREVREERDLAVIRSAEEAGVDLSEARSLRRGLTLDEVPWDWSEWTEEECEETLLGWIYRQRHAQGDRRAGGIDVEEVKEGNLTGIPSSEAKLAPRGVRKSGIQTVLETTITPSKIAARCILRDRDMLSEADGTAGADLWNIREDGLPWREDEELVHGELTYRFKKLFLRWSERGLLKLEPTMKWSPDDSSGLGRDGMPDQCSLTYKAVDLAEERIRGTKLAAGPGNPLGTKTRRQRDAARDQASWYFREWRGGAKAGT